MANPATSASAHILVVDDDVQTLTAMQALLCAADRDVVTAGSGTEALRWILRSDFALILLDIRMPDMSGFEVATLIRKLKRSRHTPIMFLTGVGERTEWVLRGYEVGAVDYIVKPVDPEVLRSKVATFIALNGRSSSLASELAVHRTTERELFRTKEDLEIKIRERTASLIAAHERARKEVEMRQRADAALNEAKRAAEEANRAKSDFLASISHEIRTPMNAIIGLTEIALQTGLTTEQREFLDLIRASGESLLALVNDVLDISKIEAGQLAVDAIPFSLRACIGEAVKILAFEATAKGLDLSLEIAPETPDQLIGDPLRLRQIALNIACNAIKFTERGSVTVHVQPESVDDGCLCCHIWVRDTGVGIPIERQGAIFAPFCQADTSTARRYGGTGLGLTIAARLVHLMRGRIWLESTPGQGSTFHFTVRLGLSDQPGADGQLAHGASAAASAAAQQVTPRALSILLVEDNAVNRRVAQIALARAGHSIVAVDNGSGALEVLPRQHFDVVLMDVQMPGMDGIETSRAIRRLDTPSARHVPIIALTAQALATDRERCLQAGMNGYLVKPIRPTVLLNELERLGLTVAWPRPCAEPGTADPERATLLDLVNGDRRLLAQISKLLVTESGKHLAALKDAIERGDRERFTRAAHTVRGMLRSLSATAADRVAATLEALDPQRQKEQALESLERLTYEMAALRKALVDAVRSTNQHRRGNGAAIALSASGVSGRGS